MSWECLNRLANEGQAEIVSKIASPYVTNIVYKHEDRCYTVNLYHDDWCSQKITRYELVG